METSWSCFSASIYSFIACIARMVPSGEYVNKMSCIMYDHVVRTWLPTPDHSYILLRSFRWHIKLVYNRPVNFYPMRNHTFRPFFQSNVIIFGIFGHSFVFKIHWPFSLPYLIQDILCQLLSFDLSNCCKNFRSMLFSRISDFIGKNVTR